MSSRNPIDAILEAERAVEVEIDRHREEARQTVNQAMQSARAISERAHGRISKIHSRYASAVKTQCAEMRQAYDVLPNADLDDAATDARLKRVVRRIAEKITGGRDA